MFTHPSLKMLITDDDKGFCDDLTLVLQDKVAEIYTANNIGDAYDIYKEKHPDVLLTDVAVPYSTEGFDLMRRIRSTDMLTVIILMSGRWLNGNDVSVGLNQGANDYIRIPFELSELSARINKCDIRQAISFGNSRYIASSRTLVVCDKVYQLTFMQAMVLSMLLQHLGDLVFRGEISKRLWEYERQQSRAIDMHIRNLRRMLKDDPSIEIKTCWQLGYKLEVMK